MQSAFPSKDYLQSLYEKVIRASIFKAMEYFHQQFPPSAPKDPTKEGQIRT